MALQKYHFIQAALASLMIISISGCEKTVEMADAKEAPAATIAVATDASVLEKINLALNEDESLANTNIKVTINKGDVNLTGMVSNQSQHDQALMLVKGSEGVVRVNDKLSVKPKE